MLEREARSNHGVFLVPTRHSDAWDSHTPQLVPASSETAGVPLQQEYLQQPACVQRGTAHVAWWRFHPGLRASCLSGTISLLQKLHRRRTPENTCSALESLSSGKSKTRHLHPIPIVPPVQRQSPQQKSVYSKQYCLAIQFAHTPSLSVSRETDLESLSGGQILNAGRERHFLTLCPEPFNL